MSDPDKVLTAFLGLRPEMKEARLLQEKKLDVHATKGYVMVIHVTPEHPGMMHCIAYDFDAPTKFRIAWWPISRMQPQTAAACLSTSVGAGANRTKTHTD